MSRRGPRQWLVTHIVEPFPVLFAQTTLTEEQIKSGPHYAAGSKYYDFPTEKNRAFREWQAEELRKRGYTVLVYTETRAA